jgi:hypothetical protein
MVNQDTDIVALMDIATLVHDTEYKTKQSFGESDPQRLKLDVLESIVAGGNFHKDIADIKSLVSDLVEIIEKYETEPLEATA